MNLKMKGISPGTTGESEDGKKSGDVLFFFNFYFGLHWVFLESFL